MTALAVLPVLALGACSQGSSSTPSASPSASASASAAPGSLSVDGVTVSGAPDQQPTITVDTAATPPSQLVVKEITPGDGKAVGPNSQVTVQYTGVAWSSGKEFDSSWATGQPATFPIQGVITGWQQGLQGVKEGERVLLIIPPDQGYGEAPPPQSGIAANDTLVFVVDVIKVQS